jgi:RHS repeat-associated protein
VWTGSLLGGLADASGQMYMRNRYYDPVTGQFTQADPVGLAGGLNAYGFAAGDPVSFDDPFGLYVCLRVNHRQGSREDQISIVKAALELATGAKIPLDASNCISQVIGNPDNELYRRLRALVAHPLRINIRFLSDPAARSGQHQAEWGPKWELNDPDDAWGRSNCLRSWRLRRNSPAMHIRWP